MIGARHVDGDVSIGRHVDMGGDLDVKGNADVRHDLRVEGWLKARNVKDILKGMYASMEDLRRAYPTPQEGWFAGVVKTEDGGTQYVGVVAKRVEDSVEWVETGELPKLEMYASTALVEEMVGKARTRLETRFDERWPRLRVTEANFKSGTEEVYINGLFYNDGYTLLLADPDDSTWSMGIVSNMLDTNDEVWIMAQAKL